MRITVKEPINDTELELNAEPEDYNGDQGWRIISSESKESFVIVHKDGEWNVVDDDTINHEIVEAIGKVLQSETRYNPLPQ